MNSFVKLWQVETKQLFMNMNEKLVEKIHEFKIFIEDNLDKCVLKALDEKLERGVTKAVEKNG